MPITAKITFYSTNENKNLKIRTSKFSGISDVIRIYWNERALRNMEYILYSDTDIHIDELETYEE